MCMSEEGKAYDLKHRLLEYFERKRKQVPITHGALHNKSSIDPIPEAAYIGDPAYVFDFLDHYKVIRVPTNAGWGISNVGSGGNSSAPFGLYVYTGTTANSRGMVYAEAFFLNSGDINYNMIDWRKYMEIRFNLVRVNSDPECVARIQLKEVNAEGALAQRGVGVSISNLDMVGESYGTQRGTVNLGALTLSKLKRIRIVKTGSEVQFWVDNVLVGRLTGNYVPNVQGTADAFFVISIINGATGGVNAYNIINDIIIIQAW